MAVCLLVLCRAAEEVMTYCGRRTDSTRRAAGLSVRIGTGAGDGGRWLRLRAGSVDTKPRAKSRSRAAGGGARPTRVASILAQMKSVIVGTAGHIDHGKTLLVKALTGIDADRLEEEKRRGITIDIGLAH